MTVKEVMSTFSSGVMYKLIGAQTGRTLASRWTNQESHIAKYYEHEVASIFPSLRQVDFCSGCERFYPIICVWVRGE